MDVCTPHAALTPATSAIFTGPVSSAPVADGLAGSDRLKISLVRFAAGSCTRWHVHDGDQLLLIAAGRGRIVSRDTVSEVGAGDSVRVPAGEEHYHAAAADSELSHFSLLCGSATSLLEEVAGAGPAATSSQR